ncbi:MAG: beta-N-acetylhexosaminidase, partial [Bryobacteraceae bacterium]
MRLIWTAVPGVLISALLCQADPPSIFPLPREIHARNNNFTIDDRVVVALPMKASAHDAQLAEILVDDAIDRYHVAIHTIRTPRLPHGARMIVMGTWSNALVAEYCAAHHIAISANNPGAEGYVLDVSPEAVLIAGSDDRGAFHGLQSLRQLLHKDAGGLQVPGALVRDWPYQPFRAIRLYLPGRDNIPFFKRFLRDFMALYKYNTVVIETGGAMRLKRHPEINAGWLDLVNDLHYTERYNPHGPHGEYQDSSHQDTADGAILEQEEVADIVTYARKYFIDVIPEIPSLTHSYYLLARHRDLAEIPDEQWPGTYCPSNPKTYALLFDVLDEYIQVMKPRMIHIGHDEWFAPVGRCARCRGKNLGDLFATDVNKIHRYLAARGIKTTMYGD